jgi:hypothetical protein
VSRVCCVYMYIQYLPPSGVCKPKILRVGYELQSAAPAGSSPWFYRGVPVRVLYVSSSPYPVHVCLGVSEGSTALRNLNCVIYSAVSRVMRDSCSAATANARV